MKIKLTWKDRWFLIRRLMQRYREECGRPSLRDWGSFHPRRKLVIIIATLLAIIYLSIPPSHQKEELHSHQRAPVSEYDLTK